MVEIPLGLFTLINTMKEKKRGISKEDYIKEYDKEKLEEAFKIALDTRKFEIELYWKRTGYFVLFIGAVFVGYYKMLQSIDNGSNDIQKELLFLFFSLLGFILSLLWYIANRGSKFWQENWEAHIEVLSTHLGIPIFGIINYCKSTKSDLMKEYPFSVSKVNQMISLIVTISWFFLFIFNIFYLIFKNDWATMTREYVFMVCVVIFFVMFVVVFPLLLEIILRNCESFATNVQCDNTFFYNYGNTSLRKKRKARNNIRRIKALLIFLTK